MHVTVNQRIFTIMMIYYSFFDFQFDLFASQLNAILKLIKSGQREGEAYKNLGG